MKKKADPVDRDKSFVGRDQTFDRQGVIHHPSFAYPKAQRLAIDARVYVD
jgi:hypothetical protein